MKKNILIAIVSAGMLLAGCKKSGSDSSTSPTIVNTNTDFEFIKRNYYLGEIVTVELKNDNPDYTIDFGDGTKRLATRANLNHTYSKGGNYQISVSYGDHKSTQNIRIYPGTTSYQFNNVLLVDIASIDSRCFQSIDTVNLLRSGALSDTIYANSQNSGTGLDFYIGVKIRANNSASAYELYTYRNTPAIFNHQHNVININPAVLIPAQ